MSEPLSPRESNPFFSAALTEATDNVVGSLEFILARVLRANDPQECYAKDLIQACGAARGEEVRDASRRLKTVYGKDLNLNQWNADVRDARAKLLTALPSNLITNDKGTPKAILANAIIQMRGKVDLAWDDFSNKAVHRSCPAWQRSQDTEECAADAPWRDYDDVAAANHLQHSGVTVTSAVANEAGFYLAHENHIHPVRDWLVSLAWDGTPRLDSWVSDYMGVESSVYLQAIGAKWVISAVARIVRPGCKADYMIVLEGPQRQGKSRALRALTNGHLDGDKGVQWFRDALPDIEKDDIGLYMQGVWIIEVAELEAIRGKQWTKVKSFISSQSDTFRRKYGRNMQDYPRQCVFAGSTNEHHWGGDPTGLTRFWPIRVSERIDVDGILRVRDQLWAEARYRYDEGETWWLDEVTEATAKTHQAERAPDDSWTERVARVLEQWPGDDISVMEVLDRIGLSLERQGQAESTRAARALTALGWERFRPRVDGARVWRYRKAY